MASISDIFDWLNQGAQGDIPGTGAQGAASAAADQAQAADYPRAYPAPSSVAEGQQGDYASQAANKAIIAGPGVTPEDYTGALSHDQLDQYNALVQAGIPPSMAHMILTQGGGQLQSNRPPSKPSGQKQGGQQQNPGYQLGHMAGSGLHSLLFGPSSQQSQQEGQSQGHQGLFQALSNWFNPPQQQSDFSDLFTGGLY